MSHLYRVDGDQLNVGLLVESKALVLVEPDMHEMQRTDEEYSLPPGRYLIVEADDE